MPFLILLSYQRSAPLGTAAPQCGIAGCCAPPGTAAPQCGIAGCCAPPGTAAPQCGSYSHGSTLPFLNSLRQHGFSTTIRSSPKRTPQAVRLDSPRQLDSPPAGCHIELPPFPLCRVVSLDRLAAKGTAKKAPSRKVDECLDDPFAFMELDPCDLTRGVKSQRALELSFPS